MENRTPDERLEALTDEVRRLTERVARLEAERPAAPARALPEASPQTPSVSPETGEGGAGWGAASTILSRTAIVCFVLVVALVLRTLADAGLLGPSSGAALGLGYAGALLASGWCLHPRKPTTGSLFGVCGSLLLCAVVLEAGTRLGGLSFPAAYWVLAGAGGALALLGLRGVAPAVAAGVPALLVTAFLLGNPDHPFAALSGVVFAGFLAAVSVGRLPRCAWVPWVAVAATAGLWWGWAQKAWGMSPGEESWYLPALTAFVALHLAAAFRRGWTSVPGGAGILSAVLPAATVGWAFPAAAAYAKGAPWLGGVGLAGSGVLLFSAWVLGRRGPEGATGPGAFSFGAACLFAAALTSGLGLTAGAVPLLSAAALGLAVLGDRWSSGATRAASYALQVGAAVWAAASGSMAAGQAFLVPSAAAGGAALLAWAHYRRCRARPPPPRSWFFTRVDRTDDTAVTLLLGSLVLCFLALRAAVYPVVAAWATDVAGAFQGAQSVILHLSALGLTMAALLRRDRELRAVGLLVTGVAALKAFLYDLLSVGGVPVVVSVLVFGASAGAIAVLLRRWPDRGEGSTASEGSPASVSSK